MENKIQITEVIEKVGSFGKRTAFYYQINGLVVAKQFQQLPDKTKFETTVYKKPLEQIPTSSFHSLEFEYTF